MYPCQASAFCAERFEHPAAVSPADLHGLVRGFLLAVPPTGEGIGAIIGGNGNAAVLDPAKAPAVTPAATTNGFRLSGFRTGEVFGYEIAFGAEGMGYGRIIVVMSWWRRLSVPRIWLLLIIRYGRLLLVCLAGRWRRRHVVFDWPAGPEHSPNRWQDGKNGPEHNPWLPGSGRFPASRRNGP